MFKLGFRVLLACMCLGPSYLNLLGGLYVLDAKTCEKGVCASFIIHFEVADLGDHGAVVIVACLLGVLSWLMSTCSIDFSHMLSPIFRSVMADGS